MITILKIIGIVMICICTLVGSFVLCTLGAIAYKYRDRGEEDGSDYDME